jgi:hypothetical protein
MAADDAHSMIPKFDRKPIKYSPVTVAGSLVITPSGMFLKDPTRYKADITRRSKITIKRTMITICFGTLIPCIMSQTSPPDYRFISRNLAAYYVNNQIRLWNNL